MTKYYYENKLSNQNITAKPNIVWVADCTLLDLGVSTKIHLFLCIDIHTNCIVTHKTSKKTINSKQVITGIEKAIRKRFLIKPKLKLIIHTDRGTQFSSQAYNKFTENYKEIFTPSMSRENTPTDNAVAERFMRTFKQHQINGLTIEEKIQTQLNIYPNFKSFRRVINQYVKSLNEKPNKKSNKTSPHKHDNRSNTASMLMIEPKHTKAFSERFGKDPRATDVKNYVLQSKKVMSILDELAIYKAEVVENTPFDLYENNIALKMIDKRIQELYLLVANNPEITREYVENAIEPLREELEEGIEEIKQLVSPKPKRKKDVLPLRDPLSKDLYPIFLNNAGTTFKYQKELRQAQLRIAYTILYYVGLRINEIRKLTEEDTINAIKSHQLNIIHFKTNQPHIHILSKRAVKDLRKLENEFKIVFQKYKYKYLFGKNKPIITKSLIRIINKDLKNTSESAGLPYNIKSHSFRINVISNLLKHTTVQNAADIIGHNDIRSTLSYRRYALSRTEIQDLLDKIS